MNTGELRGLPPANWEEDPDWTCALEGCSRIVVRATLFCRQHWTMLPARLQKLCIVARAHHQAGDERAEPSRRAAIDECSRYIRWMRGG